MIKKSQKTDSFSMQRKLMLWLSAAILLAGLVSAGVSFYQAYDEVQGFQDDTLDNIAGILVQQYEMQQNSAATNKSNFLITATDSLSVQDDDTQIRISFTASPFDSSALAKTDVSNTAANNHADHKNDKNIEITTQNFEGNAWRVLTAHNTDGSFFTVAQPADIRHELALTSAMTPTLTNLALWVVLLVLVAALLHRLFSPLNKLAHELSARSTSELTPLDVSGIANETKPFVTATNQMMAKLSTAITKQKRFVANAAHELRSPLTAMSIQTQHLLKLTDSERNVDKTELHEQIEKLHTRIRRNQDLTEQLLTLAKAEQIEKGTEVTDLQPTLKLVINLLLPIAQEKSINLEVDLEDGKSLFLFIHPDALTSILKNTIHNALIYSPNGGTVTILTKNTQSGLALSVSDKGPGIPADKRDEVLEPFTRLDSSIAGTGLGLAIVKEVCDRLGIQITLTDAQADKTGLCVTFHIPSSLMSATKAS